jgi:hypothetical protein
VDRAGEAGALGLLRIRCARSSASYGADAGAHQGQTKGAVGAAWGLVQALHRGRHMNAVDNIEHTGAPLDTATLQRVKACRMEVMEYLIEQGDRSIAHREFPELKSAIQNYSAVVMQ